MSKNRDIMRFKIPEENDSNYVFRDLARISPSNRIAQSNIIQFYYGHGNMGDCFSVLGIQQMLAIPVDTWSISDNDHDDDTIDFDFINKNYTCAILGGGGLVHGNFSNFLKKMNQECSIPMIAWGIGACLPKRSSGQKKFKDGVDKQLVQAIIKKCGPVNLRDSLTASFYELQDVIIAPCPAMIYAQKFVKYKDKDHPVILYASHENHPLVPEKDREDIRLILNRLSMPYIVIDHLADGSKMTLNAIEQVFLNGYCKSNLVVTTRFHGAVIAYAMGIPYIALPYDKKLIDFHKTHGNGLLAKNIVDLSKLLEEVLNGTQSIPLKPINLDSILSFKQRAVSWLAQYL